MFFFNRSTVSTFNNGRNRSINKLILFETQFYAIPWRKLCDDDQFGFVTKATLSELTFIKT